MVNGVGKMWLFFFLCREDDGELKIRGLWERKNSNRGRGRLRMGGEKFKTGGEAAVIGFFSVFFCGLGFFCCIFWCFQNRPPFV